MSIACIGWNIFSCYIDIQPQAVYIPVDFCPPWGSWIIKEFLICLRAILSGYRYRGKCVPEGINIGSIAIISRIVQLGRSVFNWHRRLKFHLDLVIAGNQTVLGYHLYAQEFTIIEFDDFRRRCPCIYSIGCFSKCYCRQGIICGDGNIKPVTRL